MSYVVPVQVWVIRDSRHFDPCGHHGSLESAYRELAVSIMLKEDRHMCVDSNNDAALDKYIAIQNRLARFLQFLDSRK